MSQYVHNPDEAKEYYSRYRLIYITIFSIFLIFMGRLWYLQLIRGSELREFSEKNRIKTSKIMAPRGLMLDRDGKILVENIPGFEAVISPQYTENLQETAHVIGPILGIEPSKIISRVNISRRKNGPFFPVRVKENLNRDELFRLKNLRLAHPGLDVRESVFRHYPLGASGAQLFGYVGEISKNQIADMNEKYIGTMEFSQGDIIGKSGLEETLEREIRGRDGLSYVQVDARGREATTQSLGIFGEGIRDQDALPGHNVVLTIDKDIQEAAWRSFTGLGRIGAVFAMKSNGEVLAWVSTPSFDPNEFSKGIKPELLQKIISDPFKPLRNKVIQDHAAPGSTFKAFVALSALQDKFITDRTIVPAPGVFRFGNRPYHDSRKEGHGNITVYQALERSSNVFFYKMGIGLGIDRLAHYIKPLGIGTRTGIELRREVPGQMPTSEWKKNNLGEEWQPGENLSNAIGQGFVLATPIQLAVGYNAIGLEGIVVKPFIVKRVLDQEGHILRENQPQVIRDVSELTPEQGRIDKSTFKIVKEGLRLVVNGEGGTARGHKLPYVMIAGKTGTSQVQSFSVDQIYTKCESKPIHVRHHGWFVAYAPADKPEIAVAVLAEHSCHGGSGAAPTVKEIMNTYFQKYHPEMIEAAKNQRQAKKAAPVVAPPVTPPPAVEEE